MKRRKALTGMGLMENLGVYLGAVLIFESPRYSAHSGRQARQPHACKTQEQQPRCIFEGLVPAIQFGLVLGLCELSCLARQAQAPQKYIGVLRLASLSDAQRGRIWFNDSALSDTRTVGLGAETREIGWRSQSPSVERLAGHAAPEGETCEGLG